MCQDVVLSAAAMREAAGAARVRRVMEYMWTAVELGSTEAAVSAIVAQVAPRCQRSAGARAGG